MVNVQIICFSKYFEADKTQGESMKVTSENQEEIKGIECRFVVHRPTKDPEIPDIHLIKETVHYKNGTTKPKIRIVKDYERPFYVTKVNERTYTQKKEWEHISRLTKYKCTQSQLRNKVAQALGKGWSRETLRQLQESPYLYGTDITSTAYIKNSYRKKWPDLETACSVCTYDIETNVNTPEKEILMASACFEKQAKVWVCRSFLDGFHDIDKKFNQTIDKYLSKYKAEYGFEMIVCDSELEVIVRSFEQVHKWMPDFLAIWNMDYDIPTIEKRLKAHNVYPGKVFCDPSLPDSLKWYRYKRGMDKMVTASGVHKPKPPSSQWHTLFCMSSFYVIDAMCVYRLLRLSEQEEPSYALDSILKKILGERKLSFEEASHLEGEEWHALMQTSYKFEYIAYNIFDSLGMLALDAKTTDLKYKIASSTSISEYSRADSLPKKIHDDIHFEYIYEGYISGTAGPVREKTENEEAENEENEDNDAEDEDEDLHDTLGLKGWIMTLASFLSALGLPVIKEDPTLPSGFRFMVFDSDSLSAYPKATCAGNVSKETTVFEMIDVEGIEETEFRMQNLNSVLGQCNAIEYCVKMYGMPKPEELLDLI